MNRERVRWSAPCRRAWRTRPAAMTRRPSRGGRGASGRRGDAHVAGARPRGDTAEQYYQSVESELTGIAANALATDAVLARYGPGSGTCRRCASRDAAVASVWPGHGAQPPGGGRPGLRVMAVGERTSADTGRGSQVKLQQRAAALVDDIDPIPPASGSDVAVCDRPRGSGERDWRLSRQHQHATCTGRDHDGAGRRSGRASAAARARSRRVGKRAETICHVVSLPNPCSPHRSPATSTRWYDVTETRGHDNDWGACARHGVPGLALRGDRRRGDPQTRSPTWTSVS